MNRIEMFVELKKNPNKRFGRVPKNKAETSNTEYWVEDGKIYKNYINENHESKWEITMLWFDDDAEYTEIIRPLWEVIEDGDEYWFVDFRAYESVDYTTHSNCLRERTFKERHNMFRTKEEALTKAKELLKVLKN